MLTPVNVKTMKDAVKTCLAANQPVCVWGQPGVGKSQAIRQVWQETQSQYTDYRDVRTALLDAVDLRGLPHVKEGRSHWASPEWLPTGGSGIFLLDELNRSVSMVQNAWLQFVQDRALGEYQFPRDWRIVAACNDVADGGGISKLNSALCNRFVHLQVLPDLDGWCKWAVANNVEPSVIAFLRFRPELLCKFDKDSKAYPTPRAWERLSNLIKQNPAREIELYLFEGTVGHGACIEFMAFLQMFRNLPSIDSILLSPESAVVPTEAGTLWAIATALSRRLSHNNSSRVFTYLSRMPQEYQVMAVRDAIGRDANLHSAPGMSNWNIQNSDVIF